MKILVTGSSGFVGGHLTKNLSRHEVVPYDIKEGRDILDEARLRKHLKGVDVVVHLAGLVSGPDSLKRPDDYLRTNGWGSYLVIKNSIKSGVKRIIITSSAAVYGQPLNPYGASKIWAESSAESLKSQIEVVVQRPFNIYGINQNPAYGYAIHSFIEGIMKNGSVNIYGDGRQTRDFIYVDDIVKFYKYLITAKKVPNFPFDLGTGRSVEVLKLASIIGKILKRGYKKVFLPKRIEHYESRAKTKDLANFYDMGSFVNLETGIKKLLKLQGMI